MVFLFENGGVGFVNDHPNIMTVDSETAMQQGKYFLEEIMPKLPRAHPVPV